MLGSPLGHEDFVARQLQRKRADQDRLLERIPTLDDLQAAWLLLQSCAAPRANYLLRILPPHLTADYAAAHDASVARCLAALLEQGETPLPADMNLDVPVADARRIEVVANGLPLWHGSQLAADATIVPPYAAGPGPPPR